MMMSPNMEPRDTSKMRCLLRAVSVPIESRIATISVIGVIVSPKKNPIAGIDIRYASKKSKNNPASKMVLEIDMGSLDREGAESLVNVVPMSIICAI